MTSDQQKDFEHQWPALALRVNRLLRRKKLSPWLVEDLTQETGLRLIRMWPTIDQAEPLWPLTATIALNLMRDHMRKDGSHELTYGVPETASVENVERRGMARLELQAVGGALSQMADTHRRVLLAEVSAGDKAPDATATRMLRMRARRKLQNLLDHASLLGIAVGDQLRRVVREAEMMISKALPNHIEHVSAAAISLLAAVSLGIAVVPDTPSEAGVPRRTSPTTTNLGERATIDALASDGIADAAGTRAASLKGRRADGASDRNHGRRKDGGSGGGYGGQEDHPPFPGSTNYHLGVTDDTYVRGTIEAEIIGSQDLGQRDQDPPRGVGSVNCTVAPASSGASCTHQGDGWEERGVRARHEGEATVAGRRIY